MVLLLRLFAIHLTFWLIAHIEPAILMLVVIAGRALVHSVDYGIVGVGLHMLLQILRTLEGLATELASMRFQGYVDSDVRGDVVAFDNLHIAICPCALLRGGQYYILEVRIDLQDVARELLCGLLFGSQNTKGERGEGGAHTKLRLFVLFRPMCLSHT